MEKSVTTRIQQLVKPALRDILFRMGLLETVQKIRQSPRSPPVRYNNQTFHGLNPMVTYPDWTIDPGISSASLNVLLPALEMRLMSGGPNTVINLACRVSALGIPVRFFTLEVPLATAKETLLEHFEKVSQGCLRRDLISFHDASHDGKKVPIGSRDYFLASAWWTVQSIKAFMKSQAKPFFYMIQDYEPGFYSWGLHHAMALESYDQSFIPIFNSSQLKDFFIESEKTDASAAQSFVPSVDNKHFYFDRNAKRAKKRLLFYARPSIAPRNLYELGLQALYECSKEGLFADWELNFMGERTPDVNFDSGVTIKCLPWMDFEAYARLLRSSDIVLSLMLSPHPSYTPLEAAASGCTVITNSYKTKTPESMQNISANIICSSPYLAELKASIREAVERSSDLQNRELNSKMNLPKNWTDAFDQIPKKIAQVVNGQA